MTERLAADMAADMSATEVAATAKKSSPAAAHTVIEHLPSPHFAAAVASDDDSDAAAAPGDGITRFADLGLPEPLLKAITEEGYELPTPIQARAIPLLLSGHDMIGQAQTGTGKTCAFALPMLNAVDTGKHAVQALVLCPTRELALQVAGSVFTYGKHLARVSTLAVYGGESMFHQLGRLSKGVHVVVGTPGRVLDHIRRGSLKLDAVRFMVLDEADEMLRMGFIDDVEEILSHTPATRQTALFSATMPSEIQRIAQRHLKNPERIAIASQEKTVESITQSYLVLPESHKTEALLRVLELAQPEAALVFARTRAGASELADRLTAKGYPAEALHSDLSQSQRTLVLERMRNKRCNIVVATDVAARGLDIDHISHVFNFDLPSDSETYVHRIGRTGRAGRTGEALLLVTPGQRGLLRALERYTKKPLVPYTLPTKKMLAEKRRQRMTEKMTTAMQASIPPVYSELVEQILKALPSDLEGQPGQEIQAKQLAAAALQLLAVDKPLHGDSGHDPLAQPLRPEARGRDNRSFGADDRYQNRDRDRGGRIDKSSYGSSDRDPRRSSRPGDDRGFREDRGFRDDRPGRPDRDDTVQPGMARLLLAVGHAHGIRPQDVVGAIANEAGIPGKAIGHINIKGTSLTVDVPAASRHQVVAKMERATLRGQPAHPRILSAYPDGDDSAAAVSVDAGDAPRRRPPSGDRPGYSDRPRSSDRPSYGERPRSSDRPSGSDRPSYSERGSDEPPRRRINPAEAHGEAAPAAAPPRQPPVADRAPAERPARDASTDKEWGYAKPEAAAERRPPREPVAARDERPAYSPRPAAREEGGYGREQRAPRPQPPRGNWGFGDSGSAPARPAPEPRGGGSKPFRPAAGKPSGGYGKSDRPSGGGYGKSDRPAGGGYGKSDRPAGGGYGKSDRPAAGGYGKQKPGYGKGGSSPAAGGGYRPPKPRHSR